MNLEVFVSVLLAISCSRIIEWVVVSLARWRNAKQLERLLEEEEKKGGAKV